MKIANYKTASVGWVVTYNESKVESGSAARIGGNIAGSSKVIERVFNHYAHQRESAGLKNRFIHLKLSLSPLDQHISSATFRAIAQKVLYGLGLNDNAHIIYRHYDTQHPHIHVVISRITFKGKLIRDSYDGLLLKRLERELEKDFKLTPNAARLLSPKGVRLAQKWEKERSERTGIKSVRAYLQCGIIEALQDRPSLTVFVKRLERRGIKIFHRKFERNGKVYHGLSYTLDPSMLTIRFTNKDATGRVGGTREKDLQKLISLEPVEVDHSYFGKIKARIITNLRGIPELCFNRQRPDNKMKPYSFRASNLGPLFQYASIIEQLSFVEPDTLQYITLKTKKKPQPVDYKRNLLTAIEAGLSRLLLAAELRSAPKVKEAFLNNTQMKNLENLDRELSDEELNFIRAVIDAADTKSVGQNAQTEQVSDFAALFFRFRNLAGEQPNAATIGAIRLIAEKDWKALETLITDAQKIEDRKAAPHSTIMYLGISSSISLEMLNYHNWFTNTHSQTIEEEISAKRRKVTEDTTQLLHALIDFDENKVREILATGQPDVRLIALEHLGKVTDTQLAQQLQNLAGIKSEIAPPKQPELDKIPDSNVHVQKEELHKEKGQQIG